MKLMLLSCVFDRKMPLNAYQADRADPLELVS